MLDTGGHNRQVTNRYKRLGSERLGTGKCRRLGAGGYRRPGMGGCGKPGTVRNKRGDQYGREMESLA